MRDIWFRGQRFDGVWVEGYFFAKPILEKYFIICGENQWMVKPETVGQYTDMRDKNGNKIFEGDIVILDEDVKKAFNVDDGEVRYGWGGFYIKEFSSLNSLNVLASYVCLLRGEVIGNIHDNPELLEN